jgi:Ankyrin repeats (many copies)
VRSWYGGWGELDEGFVGPDSEREMRVIGGLGSWLDGKFSVSHAGDLIGTRMGRRCQGAAVMFSATADSEGCGLADFCALARLAGIWSWATRQALSSAFSTANPSARINEGGPMATNLAGEFEVHSPAGIRKMLAAGVSPTEPIHGMRPIDLLIVMYLRSPRFAECLQVMLDAGATVGDPLLQAVLLDDDAELRALLAKSPESLQRKLNPLCAFTSCRGVSALHICAEFNSTRCARVLLESGADVNARSDQDADGVGGQTPVFHAVNSILNYCRPVMEILVDAGADLDVRVRSLLWGESMNWETVVHDVTPTSYAQCGLYRQFHRSEEDVYSNIEYLYRKRHGMKPPFRNVPNKYLVIGH